MNLPIAETSQQVGPPEINFTATRSQRSWYVLHVRPSYEIVVSSRLKELETEEYVPMRSEEPRSRFQSGLPLFPGYVFS
jgi:hypothetical protein